MPERPTRGRAAEQGTRERIGTSRDKKEGPGKTRTLEHSMAGYAGLEPATSDVTGRRSNQLS
jgi:hypothetical protein